MGSFKARAHESAAGSRPAGMLDRGRGESRLRPLRAGEPARGAPAMGRSASALALVVVLSAQLMVVLDFSIVNVALPSIQRELAFSATGLEWVVTAYAITFGGLLILGGRAGEFRADQVLASEFRAATFRPDPHGAMLTEQVRCPPAGAAATDGW